MMMRIYAALFLNTSALAGLHHLVRHGSSSGLDADPVAGIFGATVIGIVVFGSIIGLSSGTLVLALTRRMTHVLWAVPAANLSVYLLVLGLRPYPGGFAAQFQAPGRAYTVAEFILLLTQSLVLAGLVTTVHRLARWLRGKIGPKLVGSKSGDAYDAYGRDDGSWLLYLNRSQTQSPWASLTEGFSAPRYGLSFLTRHPELWSYAIVPIVLNLLITALILSLLLLIGIGLVAHLHPLFPSGGAWWLLELVCAIVLLMLVVLVALGAWFLLQGILCGHFYGRLARQVEIHLGTPPESLGELSFRYQAVDSLRDLGSLVMLNGGLLVLHVIPVLGSIASLAATAYCDCLLFGHEYMEYPLALRGRSRRDRIVFVRQHRAHVIGLGGSVLLMNLVPLVGSAAMVTAVVGAVLLHRRLTVTGAAQEASSEPLQGP